MWASDPVHAACRLCVGPRGLRGIHIDRLARNAADTIRLREEMEFRGIEIHTCASGLVTEMHAGLEGLMSAMYFNRCLHGRLRRDLCWIEI